MPVPHTPPASERQLLRDTVRSRIHDAIMDGTLEPGERLNDDELSAWLGASRTPIRAALGELARAGLVEMAPNRYTKVALPRESQAIEALQTLGVLLGGVVRLAVPRLSDARRAGILAALDVTIAEMGERDVASFNHDSLGTFTMFVDGCGNDALIRVCRDTMDGLSYQLRLPTLPTIVDWERMIADFRRLRTATAEGDAIAAELATEALYQLPGEDD